jgi:hypothetical protein
MLPSIRSDIERWMGGSVQPSTVKLARDALGVLQLTEPPGGWDAFEGDWSYRQQPS